jgi:ABC-2 type transport system ATP-binding protein
VHPRTPASTLAAGALGADHRWHMSIISIQNLTKDFGPVRAVDDLSFDIDEGKVVGFLGPNGSGKTTTLRSLVGLVTPTSGSATIHGLPYAALREPLTQLGVMLEAASHPARTARNHLRVLAAEGGLPLSRADEMLELVDLGGAARRRSGGFSLGMTQRLGLAAALLGDPRILVLDEPANGLDPEGIRWLRDFLRDLAAEGRTVLLSSHVLSEVAQTVDEVVVINHGRLIAHSTLDALSAGAGPRVRVRSPQLEQLAGVLTAWGFDARRDGSGALVVTGSSQEKIGQLAFDHGVVLHEIAAESSNLEDVFFDLTATPALEVAA